MTREEKLTAVNELRLRNVKGFFIRKVTKFGTSAKVDCPKRYMGRKVYLVIL